MLTEPNALQWDGRPGHYEVHYLTATDPATGVGVWIRYTILAPLQSGGEPASCALWFLAMDPRAGRSPTWGRKASRPIGELRARSEPFELRIGDAALSERGAAGAVDDAAWELEWTPSARAYEHVHPILRRTGVAQTILVLPQPDLAISGTISFGGERLELAGARGAQAHLWGRKHASSWAWVHCNDFSTAEGTPVPGAFIDAVSVTLPRLGREVGPSTPVVGRLDGEDFCSTTPLRVLRNASTYALTGWRFEAIAGRRKLIGEIDADRGLLAGVTYHDPDGELAYCYNSEVATMRLSIYERARQTGGWAHRSSLAAPGRAHFEYAQRAPVPDVALLTR